MKILSVAWLAALALQPALANETKPSEQSVDRLFEVMHTSQLLDTYASQIDAAMRASLRQGPEWVQLNAEQQQIVDDMSTELTSLIKHEISWQSVRPMMVEVYRNTFSAHEVDEMVKFYQSPAGQAVISKLPAAMAQAMQAMQERVRALTPKLTQLHRETLAALKRAQNRAPQDQTLPPAAQASEPAASPAPDPAPPPSPQPPLRRP
jgi:uncharacterized protein